MVVAFAAAQRAEVFRFGVVVVGVETADHALARTRHGPRNAADFQSNAGSRLAL